MEQWKDVSGYEGLYQVSDLGRVRSLDRVVNCNGGTRRARGRVLTPSTVLGYCNVTLQDALTGRQKIYRVHRLVMLAFVGPSDLEVNHKDGDKANNQLSNLEYVNSSENKRHAISALGVVYGRNLRALPGEESGKAILTEGQVLEIRRLYGTGNYIQRQLADMFNVTRSAINAVVNRQSWTHI